MLAYVTSNFSIDPNEVSSLEAYHQDNDPSPSGSNPTYDEYGTIVIQKNGRKTYLKNLTVKECHDLIFGKIVYSKK